MSGVLRGHAIPLMFNKRFENGEELALLGAQRVFRIQSLLCVLVHLVSVFLLDHLEHGVGKGIFVLEIEHAAVAEFIQEAGNIIEVV